MKFRINLFNIFIGHTRKIRKPFGRGRESKGEGEREKEKKEEEVV